VNLLLGPYVNLNGASRKSLIEQSRAVMAAAHTLMLALSQAAPHGRDYQTRPHDGDYRHDREVWEQYRHHVGNIISDYEATITRLINKE
jgi:hypothetical protein